MPRVFICYSRKDSDFVDRLTADLKAAGVPTWRDVEDIPADDASSTFSWRRAVDRALEECTHMVVVLSPDANDSPEVQAEWNDFVTRGLPVFPVKCRETRVPYRLNSLNWFDLQDGYDAKIKHLAEQIKRVLRTGDGTEQVEAPRPTSKPDDDVPTLIVSRLGRGHYRTISEAVEAAPEGARILIKPGYYRETLEIIKPLEIIGDGPRDEIVLESDQADGLAMRTDYAVVRGLTIRGRTEGRFGVYIPQGQLILEDCDIASDTLACVAIRTPNANPIIRHCNIHDGNVDGVIVYEGGAGVIEDCEIYGNVLAGIAIINGGNPSVRRCKINGNSLVAVHVTSGSLGTIEDCDLRGNTEGAWHISNDSKVTRRNNNE